MREAAYFRSHSAQIAIGMQCVGPPGVALPQQSVRMFGNKREVAHSSN
jgi:hypothetical protein